MILYREKLLQRTRSLINLIFSLDVVRGGGRLLSKPQRQRNYRGIKRISIIPGYNINKFQRDTLFCL